jgi:hypothetical protein
MRPIIIGLIAAIMAATLPAAALAATGPKAATKGPDISADQKAAGMKAAPKLITDAGLTCVLAEARFIGQAPNAKTKLDDKYYEIGCKGSIGYILVDQGPKTPPVWEVCPKVDRFDKLTGKPYPGACWLPENQDDAAQVAPFVAKTQTPCTVSKARGIGHSDTAAYFEVACSDGRGYILQTSAPPDPGKDVKMDSCLRYPPGGQVNCTLTSYDDQMKIVDTYAAQSGKSCTVKDRRYIGEDEKDHTSFFEVSCADGKGYMLDVDATGKVNPIPCDQAFNIGGGCTLTDARAAQTEEDAVYSKLAQKAGFNCDVSKYAAFATSPAGDEAVELACGNRPDSGVGIFPVSSQDRPMVFDCAHADVVGYHCGFSTGDAVLPTLTADLNKLGKSSCVVSAQRFIAKTVDNHGYIEVACADGGRGYIIEYTSQPLAPDQAIPCVSAKQIEGGCTLPTNKG